jgi:hypothetical protein
MAMRAVSHRALAAPSHMKAAKCETTKSIVCADGSAVVGVSMSS